MIRKKETRIKRAKLAKNNITRKKMPKMQPNLGCVIETLTP